MKIVFCRDCGKEIDESAQYCFYCGEFQGINTQGNNINKTIPTYKISFSQAISICLSKFFVIKGRASRPEFWWFYLFVTLISWLQQIALANTIALENTQDFQTSYQLVNFIFQLVLAIPIFTAQIRRLHDTNRSGWNVLWIFTVIGIIPYIIWLASNGNHGPNRFGNPTQ